MNIDNPVDQLTRYQQILQQLVTRHAGYNPSHGRIETFSICDLMNDHYLLLAAGWDKTGRVHEVFFHARLKDSKIWIEWDGTDPSLTEELIEAGVPEEDIILAFYRPEYRALLEYSSN